MINRRNQQVKDLKRELILEAAENLLKEVGLEKLTMDQVAEQSSYTKRTVYRYFKGKEDILMEIFIRRSLEKWSYQKEEILKSREGLPRLKALGNSYFCFFKANPHFLKLSVFFDITGFDFSIERSDELKALYQRFYEIDQDASYIIMREIEYAKSQGEIDTNYPDEHIKGYLYYTIRTICNQLINPPPNRRHYDDETYFHHFLEILIKGFK